MDKSIITTTELKTKLTEPSKFPTEIVDLPSKGLLYPENSPLRSGVVELKYMTAKEEDILTTQSYITKGIVINKLIESLLVTKINIDDLLIGDRNAIMVAARIYGYGPMYNTMVRKSDGTEYPILFDLNDVKHKEIDPADIPTDGIFTYTTIEGDVIKFKLLTVGMVNTIEQAINRFKSAGQSDRQMTTRLRYMIVSVNDNSEPKVINDFIDHMRTIDTKGFREYINKIQPDIELSYYHTDEETGNSFRGKIILGADLFYPSTQ